MFSLRCAIQPLSRLALRSGIWPASSCILNAKMLAMAGKPGQQQCRLMMTSHLKRSLCLVLAERVWQRSHLSKWRLPLKSQNRKRGKTHKHWDCYPDTVYNSKQKVQEEVV